MATKKKSAEPFRKIVVVDDWGSVGYYLNAKLGPSGTWSHRDLDQNDRLKDGETLEVETPDGTSFPATARVEKVTGSYSDHGTSGTVPSEYLTLVPKKPLKLYGMKVELDIGQVKVRRIV